VYEIQVRLNSWPEEQALTIARTANEEYAYEWIGNIQNILRLLQKENEVIVSLVVVYR
jgi:hypothetical protein